MLPDFNDIWWERTGVYLQQTGKFLSLYGTIYA